MDCVGDSITYWEKLLLWKLSSTLLVLAQCFFLASQCHMAVFLPSLVTMYILQTLLRFKPNVLIVEMLLPKRCSSHFCVLCLSTVILHGFSVNPVQTASGHVAVLLWSRWECRGKYFVAFHGNCLVSDGRYDWSINLFSNECTDKWTTEACAGMFIFSLNAALNDWTGFKKTKQMLNLHHTWKNEFNKGKKKLVLYALSVSLVCCQHPRGFTVSVTMFLSVWSCQPSKDKPVLQR